MKHAVIGLTLLVGPAVAIGQQSYLAPTSYQQCEALSRSLFSVYKQVEDTHNACRAAQKKGPSWFTEQTACGEVNENWRECLPQAKQEKCAFKKYLDDPAECRRQVSAYLKRQEEQSREVILPPSHSSSTTTGSRSAPSSLSSAAPGPGCRKADDNGADRWTCPPSSSGAAATQGQQDLIRAAAEAQRSQAAAQANSQVGAVNSRTATIDAGARQANDRTAIYQQETARAQQATEIYRRQAEEAAQQRVELGANDLARIDSLRRRADALELEARARFSMPAENIAVDRSSAEYLALVEAGKSDLAMLKTWSLRENFGAAAEKVYERFTGAKEAFEEIGRVWKIQRDGGTFDEKVDAIGGGADLGFQEAPVNPLSKYVFSVGIQTITGRVKNAMGELNQILDVFQRNGTADDLIIPEEKPRPLQQGFQSFKELLKGRE